MYKRIKARSLIRYARAVVDIITYYIYFSMRSGLNRLSHEMQIFDFTEKIIATPERVVSRKGVAHCSVPFATLSQLESFFSFRANSLPVLFHTHNPYPLFHRISIRSSCFLNPYSTLLTISCKRSINLLI